MIEKYSSYYWPIAPKNLSGKGQLSSTPPLHRCWWMDINHAIRSVVWNGERREILPHDIDLGFLFNDIHVTLQRANSEVWGLQLWGIVENPQLMTGEEFLANHKSGYFLYEKEHATRKVSYICVVRKEDVQEGMSLMRITQMGYDIPLSLNVIHFIPSFMHFEPHKESFKDSLIVYGHISGDPLR